MQYHPDFSAYAQVFSREDGEGAFSSIMKNMAQLEPGSKICFTFDNFPRKYPVFYRRAKKMLKFLEAQMGVPADIEFAYEPTEDSFCLIQSRPFWTNASDLDEWPEIDEKSILLQADRMVTHGAIPEIHKIVYVDYNLYFERRDFYGTARLIGELNEASRGEPYILVAPGRIGSSSPELGVPVQYGELTNCLGMVELGIPRLGYMPELRPLHARLRRRRPQHLQHRLVRTLQMGTLGQRHHPSLQRQLRRLHGRRKKPRGDCGEAASISK